MRALIRADSPPFISDLLPTSWTHDTYGYRRLFLESSLVLFCPIELPAMVGLLSIDTYLSWFTKGLVG